MKTLSFYREADPSQTIVLRNAFAIAMRSKFNRFRKVLIEVITKDNVFGLSINKNPGQGAFSLPSSSASIAAFIQWVEEQIKDDILQITQVDQVITSAWTNPFIKDAYKKGITKARIQLKGIAPSLSETGGIEVVLTNLKHVDRLGYLYTRVFNDLKGITEAMDLDITRIIAQGIADNVKPSVIAKAVDQAIAGEVSTKIAVNARKNAAKQRAELLARTEIIRAFADAQLQEFANWGIHGVSAKAEISTAGDERVCPRCAKLEKTIFTLEEAQGIIPVHPKCRCIWLPFIEK